MFLQRLELNIAEQPCLLPDEAIIFVQDAVGLYEGYAILRHSGKQTMIVGSSHADTTHAGNTRYQAFKMAGCT